MCLHLQALRSGNYLLFLDWPRAILQAQADKNVDADATIDLLIAEWNKFGVIEDDIKKVALLYAYSELPTQPLKGNLAYALTTISMALAQCRPDQAELLSQYQITKQEIDQLNNQLQPILSRRYQLDDYITLLSTNKDEKDQLKETRLSIVRKLYTSICAKTEYNQEVQEELNTYVQKLRSMQPTEGEIKFLDYLEKPSTDNSFFQLMANLGDALFQAEPQKKESTTQQQTLNPLSFLK